MKKNAIVWYREHSTFYDSCRYHLSLEDLAWMYENLGDPSAAQRIGDYQTFQKRLDSLSSFLEDQGYAVKLLGSGNLNAVAAHPGTSFERALRSSLNAADLIVTFGGDNTLHQLASLIEHGCKTPILGLNSNPLPTGKKPGGEKSGSFGGLLWPSLEVFQRHFSALIRDATPELWTRARVELNDGILLGYALDHVFAGALKRTHASHYSINGEQQGSGGVLIYTGAGSGPVSWAGNATGSCVEFPQTAPYLKYYVTEPFGGYAEACPIVSSFRTMAPYTTRLGEVTSDEPVLLVSHHVRDAIICLDSNEVLGERPFPRGTRAVISPAPESLAVIAPPRPLDQSEDGGN